MSAGRDDEADESPEEVRRVIVETLWYEVAHHFGMDEEGVSAREAVRARRSSRNVRGSAQNAGGRDCFVTQKASMTLLFVSVTAFVLHLAWEMLHLPLYSDYEELRTLLPLPLWAALGDVLYTLLAIGLVSLFKKSGLRWIAQARVSDFIGLAVLGFLIAIGVEYKALALDRWEYSAAMPIVPLLRVGLSPIVQMTVLLPLSVYFASALLRSNSTNVHL